MRLWLRQHKRQAEATKAAQRAGIEAKKGDPNTYPGKKPSYDRKAFRQVVDMLELGHGASEIAKATDLKRQTVIRIRADQAKAEAILTKWGM